jgi:hypothetical protein
MARTNVTEVQCHSIQGIVNELPDNLFNFEHEQSILRAYSIGFPPPTKTKFPMMCSEGSRVWPEEANKNALFAV